MDNDEKQIVRDGNELAKAFAAAAEQECEELRATAIAMLGDEDDERVKVVAEDMLRSNAVETAHDLPDSVDAYRVAVRALSWFGRPANEHDDEEFRFADEQVKEAALLDRIRLAQDKQSALRAELLNVRHRILPLRGDYRTLEDALRQMGHGRDVLDEVVALLEATTPEEVDELRAKLEEEYRRKLAVGIAPYITAMALTRLAHARDALSKEDESC